MATGRLSCLLVVLYLTVTYSQAQNVSNSEHVRQKRQTLLAFSCPGYTQNIQDPSDCSYFYNCNNDQVSRLKCAVNFFFNPTTGQCSNNRNIQGCEMPTPSTSLQAPRGAYRCPVITGMFPDSTDCSKYYKCDHFASKSVSCPTGQVFYPSTHQCRRSNGVNDNPPGCHMPDKTQGICSISNGVYPDPSDCTFYWKCQNSVPTRTQCGTNLVFDPAVLRCVAWRVLFSCRMTTVDPAASTSLVTPSGAYTCHQANGNFADTSDCSKYYKCTKSVGTLMQCPPRQLFDPSVHSCGTNDHPPGCHIPDNWGVQGSIKPVVVSAVGGSSHPDPLPAALITFRCPKPNGNFQDATDCATFFVCTDSIVRRYRCADGLVFHPSSNNCDDTAAPTGCVLNPGKATQFRCQQPYGNYQNPKDCSRYYVCTNYVVTTAQCPANQNFNPNTGSCQADIRPSGCKIIGAGAFRCQQAYGNYQNPKDCSSYYVCTNYVAKMVKCPANQNFNPNTGTCQADIRPTGCKIIGGSTAEAVCARSEWASLISHPTYCNAFYMCDDGLVHRPCMFCGIGLYFDSLANTCLPDSNVNLVSKCRGKKMIAHDQKVHYQARGC